MKHFIMKCLLMVLILTWGGQLLNAQNVTGSFKGKALSEVVKELEHQTGYSFIYEISDLKSAASVTASFENAPLEKVLPEIIKSPLKYDIKGKIVVITKGEIVQQPAPKSQKSNNVVVTGVVKDAATGETLPGVTVWIKDTQYGTTTDLDGAYRIEFKGNYGFLSVSSMGFQLEEIRLSNAAEQVIDVALGKDRWDYNFAPVYLVCFLTFNMKRSLPNLTKVKEDDYISIYKYADMETGELLEDGTTLVFIELRKFCKRLEECRSERERWICSLKSMGDQLEMPKELAGTILETMYEKAALAAMPPEKRTNYISRTMSRNDELNSRAEMIEDALQEGYAKGHDEGLAEGMAKGREEGRDEGLAEGMKAIAVRMLRAGMPAEQVAQLTLLDLDAVRALQ